MKKTLLIVISFILIGASCSKGGGGGGNPLDCSSVPKSYSLNVDPIIQGFCNTAGCHTNGSVNGPGPLTNYTQVAAAKSEIRAAIQSGLMPQNTTLTTSQKNSIICWIDSGAPNN